MSDKPLEDAYVPPEPEVAKPKASTPVKVPVVLLMLEDGSGFSVAITEKSPFRAFRFPVGHYPNVRAFDLNPGDKDVEEVDLKPLRARVDAMLPTKEIIIENVLKSFLRAGAYTLDGLARAKGKALRTAFPYQLRIEE